MWGLFIEGGLSFLVLPCCSDIMLARKGVHCLGLHMLLMSEMCLEFTLIYVMVLLINPDLICTKFLYELLFT